MTSQHDITDKLFEATAEEISAMDEAALAVWLKDIESLEPPVINTPIVGNEDEEEDEAPEDKDNPIKIKRKKRVAKSAKLMTMLTEMKALEKELGL